MSTATSRSDLPEWKRLEEIARRLTVEPLGRIAADPERARRMLFRAGPLCLDFSKQRLDAEALKSLLLLAEKAGLPGKIRDMLSGGVVNPTEGRPALHTALRLPLGAELRVDGAPVVDEVHESLSRVASVVERIHSRQWRGFSGRAIQDVVNIGVGGSDLGPFMASQALGEFAPSEAEGLRIHFVSSIDGTQLADLLHTLRPETTLFIISSKSFTTIDTMANANTALQWMLNAAPDADMVIPLHFIGVSTRPDRMTAWGIPDCNQIRFWDWVGGRFSLWSAIGLPIALKIGMTHFRSMLAGAHFVDNHFRQQPLESNLPVLLGLVGVWNATFLDIRAHAVLPYDGRLKYFPSYLAQLEMESNGKSVDTGGQPIDYHTCPVLWGEVGSNAQHAFYQLLHQGTQMVSSDFIAPVRRYGLTHHDGEAHKGLQQQHQLALANCLAQTRVLMLGNSTADIRPDTPGFKRYRGNQPSTTILLDELNPHTFGMLIALYEHKVFVMSVLWDINPFDQWGVELGKKIAMDMVEALQGRPAADTDASTQQLLAEISRITGDGVGP
ncbi:glucose-6-phosphate isomerase [Fluviicoccus keumensis]|uniref:Glucose-6-phosphate isomerase n=1 Tax=Fluviicoccus keumensis TaxID=1435465 RepID=A0A4Q7Z9W0_9GAMM|nr:glucose-6-phosphate isomerase [Fluviicoccus keumensis]RZU46851.1 glucose-6-phosphate isomerase [Fluviicoccus keumensis]